MSTAKNWARLAYAFVSREAAGPPQRSAGHAPPNDAQKSTMLMRLDIWLVSRLPSYNQRRIQRTIAVSGKLAPRYAHMVLPHEPRSTTLAPDKQRYSKVVFLGRISLALSGGRGNMVTV